MLSSCPPTPALYREQATVDPNPTNQSKTSLPLLKPINNEYRLSNRKLRQLSPIEHNPTTNGTKNIDNTDEGFINHGYSSESIYNQLPATDSAVIASSTSINADSTAPAPPVLTNSKTSAPSSETNVSSNSSIPQQTFTENFKHMCSVILQLMKNTRYICIIVANLFEGILIKGKFHTYIFS